MTNSRLWPVALFSALLGGAVAVVLTVVIGIGGTETTTVVQPAGAPLSTPRTASDGVVLSARDIYKRDAPGVVFITATITQTTQSSFGMPSTQQGIATGSGFVIDREGRILTNAHVVDGATKVTVKFGDAKAVEAKILGRDRSTDVALLKIDPSGQDLQPLRLGSAKNVEVGDPVVAIGNPFGLDRTLTTGVVSALQREISGLNGFQISDVIQTDAAINPGNSGGPLIDSTGAVIGINSQIETRGGTGGNIGIGFAVPIDTARALLPQLEKGTIETGYMGISGRTIDASLDELKLGVKTGVLVIDAYPGQPAARAGIRGGNVPAQIDGQDVAIGGDVITKVDGRVIKTSADLTNYIASKRRGDKVAVTVIRGKKEKVVTVTLAARPQTAPGNQTQPTTP
ncbi:unannotated protein [freshwater metagenome]|uniref:Unannotated protein n=1 Tax=freshwater metagenome TaxID=449393 RepID=A0A6J7IH71_9ZZZZ|nr:trypsin-like serine protease [Actinomycetota bacterium]